MAQFTQLLLSRGFTTGVVRYQDYYPGQEQFARMVLPVVVAGSLTVPAIVDTGAPWCILNPEIVTQLGLVELASYVTEVGLNVRGINYPGQLFRTSITLQADEGESLDVDATVFMPISSQGEIWPHPNFVGLEGFLSRIRFAVDPAENAFYFGPLG